MQFAVASSARSTSSCNGEPFPVSSAFPMGDLLTRSASIFKPIAAGFLLTVAQLAVAVCLLAPEGPLSYRYSTLIQHDSYWFANIVDRGFQTIAPPISHKVMEVSNVAFFPAYPAIAGLLHNVFHLQTGNALLMTAQAAAWGFWTYFFLFCERWNLPPSLRFFGALSILAHPAAFFLIAAYSESLFLVALVGFLYWSSCDGRAPKIWAALHGVLMSATRIVGIPCAVFPVVQRVCAGGWSTLRSPRRWPRAYGSAVVLMVVATFGAVFFFFYCQLRWGRWDIYMLTQLAGWGIVPDYLAVFKTSSYRWLVPPLNDPKQMSQMSMTIGALVFVLLAVSELISGIRRHPNWPARAGIYFCAAIVYYVAVSGVASVEMESMMRYQFCAHALIVLALLHFLSQFKTPPVLVRVFGMAAVALGSVAGLSVQGWYVWNFTRGNWVA
ncbi:MAG: hypothetical protein ABR514_11955 [Chthoniobacterales bacterium]